MTSLKTSSLENIKFKNSMKSHITDANIVAWVVDKVQQIENVEALKYNGELVLYICSVIECACLENKIKTDKLDLHLLN